MAAPRRRPGGGQADARPGGTDKTGDRDQNLLKIAALGWTRRQWLLVRKADAAVRCWSSRPQCR